MSAVLLSVFMPPLVGSISILFSWYLSTQSFISSSSPYCGRARRAHAGGAASDGAGSKTISERSRCLRILRHALVGRPHAGRVGAASHKRAPGNHSHRRAHLREALVDDGPAERRHGRVLGRVRPVEVLPREGVNEQGEQHAFSLCPPKGRCPPNSRRPLGVNTLFHKYQSVTFPQCSQASGNWWHCTTTSPNRKSLLSTTSPCTPTTPKGAQLRV